MSMLICPKCKFKLLKENNSYKCMNNHTYDIAKSGYVNLLLSKTNAGDNKEMVSSRKAFLEKNYYLPLAIKLKDIIYSEVSHDSLILDNGCGTGYYDYIIKTINNNIIGLDISKYAIEKASKLNPDLSYIVASSNDIPLSDKSISCIVNIFSPTFPKENYRVLADDGLLIIVLPEMNHLIELKESIYDNAYLNDNLIPDYDNFSIYKKEVITFNKEINHDDIINLVNMTPYIHKTSNMDLNKLKSIDKLNITFSFNIIMYKKSTN